MREPKSSAGRGHSPFVRLLWLAACATAGFAVGALGVLVTGAPAWWLAVPAAIALGWLFFADPTQCLADGARRHGGPRQR